MTKKKWALVILCILLLLGYYKFFFKTYSEKAVAKSADHIIAIDVKRITNTVIWNTLTTPGQWKKISFSSSGAISWKDMVKIPDYVFIFHSIGQPLDKWYTVLEIKDNQDFEKGLRHYHFEKKANTEEYFSTELRFVFIRSANKILISNLSEADTNYIDQVADELFVQKAYTTKETLKRNIQSHSHFSLQLAANRLLKEATVLKANFDKRSITIDGIFNLEEQFTFSENDFKYADSSLLTAAFTQPSSTVYNLVPGPVKMKISKAVNFNIDSLLLPGNVYYYADIPGFKTGIDSAVSYTYDDNFNPVSNLVVNNVLEPALKFNIAGEHTSGIYNYWKNNNKLEKTDAGDLFTPLPFVKSYCQQINEKELRIVSYNYQEAVPNKTVKAIFFLNLLITKIPPEISRSLPDEVRNSLANLESINIVVQKGNDKLRLQASFLKKKNDLPIINW